MYQSGNYRTRAQDALDEIVTALMWVLGATVRMDMAFLLRNERGRMRPLSQSCIFRSAELLVRIALPLLSSFEVVIDGVLPVKNSQCEVLLFELAEVGRTLLA
jgi:hypothetical protein